MRKIVAIALLVSLFGFGTALADILPEGQKVVPVCAYFNNTADFLDTLTFYGYETGPDGERTDFSQFIADECFHTSYKFNSFGVYTVTVEHAATLDLETYNPEMDEEAYPTSLVIENGNLEVDEASTLESVSNEYTIVELDLEAKVLVIQPTKTIKFFNDGSEAEVIEGEITPVFITAEEEVVVDEETPVDEEVVVDEETTEVVEDLFSDVSAESEYYDSIKYLKDEGIIGGYPDGSYGPDKTINRAEFTKIVMGSISTTDELEVCMTDYMVEGDYMINLFSDVTFTAVGGNAPEWYFNFVCQAKKMNIIGGYPDGTFMPAQNINFVEAAKIITGAVSGEEMAVTDPWYKGYVMALEEKNAIPSTISSFDQMLTRGEMAEIMYRLKAEVTDLESMTYDELT